VPTKEDYQNEFSIITTKRSFTISARFVCSLILSFKWISLLSSGPVH